MQSNTINLFTQFSWELEYCYFMLCKNQMAAFVNLVYKPIQIYSFQKKIDEKLEMSVIGFSVHKVASSKNRNKCFIDHYWLF